MTDFRLVTRGPRSRVVSSATVVELGGRATGSLWSAAGYDDVPASAIMPTLIVAASPQDESPPTPAPKGAPGVLNARGSGSSTTAPTINARLLARKPRTPDMSATVSPLARSRQWNQADVTIHCRTVRVRRLTRSSHGQVDSSRARRSELSGRAPIPRQRAPGHRRARRRGSAWWPSISGTTSDRVTRNHIATGLPTCSST